MPFGAGWPRGALLYLITIRAMKGNGIKIWKMKFPRKGNLKRKDPGAGISSAIEEPQESIPGKESVGKRVAGGDVRGRGPTL